MFIEWIRNLNTMEAFIKVLWRFVSIQFFEMDMPRKITEDL
jgi:hypothetical protein